jgi:hypothetical protein
MIDSIKKLEIHILKVIGITAITWICLAVAKEYGMSPSYRLAIGASILMPSLFLISPERGYRRLMVVGAVGGFSLIAYLIIYFDIAHWWLMVFGPIFLVGYFACWYPSLRRQQQKEIASLKRNAST